MSVLVTKQVDRKTELNYQGKIHRILHNICHSFFFPVVVFGLKKVQFIV